MLIKNKGASKPSNIKQDSVDTTVNNEGTRKDGMKLSNSTHISADISNNGDRKVIYNSGPTKDGNKGSGEDSAEDKSSKNNAVNIDKAAVKTKESSSSSSSSSNTEDYIRGASGNDAESARSVCKNDGKTFEFGSFIDPTNTCNVCECFKDGSFHCKRRACKPARCGLNFQSYDSDGCCLNCDTTCRKMRCEKLSCPTNRQIFKIDSCCPVCGCKFNGAMVFEGKNCRVGNVIIKYGEFKQAGRKICTCLGEWFPNAFYAVKTISNAIRSLQKTRCVEEVSHLLKNI